MSYFEKKPFKCIWHCCFLKRATKMVGFLCLFLCIVYFVWRKWSFSRSSALCIKTYGAFYFINARGEEVLRAAARLHKPPLLHKRQNMLSNCQNLYFEACDRLAVWGSPLLLCLRCLCTSVWLTLCTWVCVCPCPRVCALFGGTHIWESMHDCVCIFNMSPSLWKPLHSDPFCWSVWLLHCASVDVINGNMPEQDEKRNCYTSWSMMTASLPGEALKGSLGLQVTNVLKICICGFSYWLG